MIIEGYDGNAGAKAVPIAKQVLDSYYYTIETTILPSYLSCYNTGKEGIIMEQESLFEEVSFQPLASRMRPASLSEYVGQKHLVGEGKFFGN